MDPKIFPEVEFAFFELPNNLFRKTNKGPIKVDDVGITINGEILKWQEIGSVQIKYSNGNPYVYLTTENTTKTHVSLLFSSKWWKRHKKPWFGVSSFLSLEFLQILEDCTQIMKKEDFEQEILENIQNPIFQQIWNIIFLILPPILILLTILILYLGFTA